MSYTTFEYGKITTDKKVYTKDETVKVSFTLSNTGTMNGAETTQLYVSQKNPSVMRPVKELKAFKKTFLNAGEKQIVSMEIPIRDFAFYDERTKEWVVEADEFVIHNAASAKDIKSSIKIKIVM